MSNVEIYPMFFKLFFTFIAALSSVLMLSQTRKISFLFIILGVVFLFVDTLYTVLVFIGVLSYNWFPDLQFPILKVILNGGPFIFLSAGFLVSYISRKRY